MIHEKVLKRISPFIEIDTNDCIEFNILNQYGYGVIQYLDKGKKCRILAHRASYEIYNKTEISSDLVIMHICDNRRCINPKHLKLGTHKDNVADRDSKGRQAKGSKNGRFTNGYYSKYENNTKEVKSKYRGVIEDSIILSIKKDFGTMSLLDISKKYNIKLHTINDIKRLRAYSHIKL